MAYQLEINEPIDVGVRRIAIELIDDAIARVEATDRDPHETVHEVRKDCKKLRGLLRLIRPRVPKLYKVENRYFRDAAAALSGIRDAEAASESYDALLAVFEGEVDRPGLAPVRRALTMHKQHLAEHQGDLDVRLDAFGEQMREARKRVTDWRLPADDRKHGKGGFRLLEGGLTKTYARGRKAMDVACGDPDVAAFHDWRKRAKYLRYQLRLLRPIWPQLFKCSRKEVKRLGDLLGDDHDLAVLEKVLKVGLDNDPDEGRMEVLDALMRQRSIQLRREAQWLGRRIYAEKPKAFRKRIGRYWATAHAEHQASLS